MLWVMGEDRYRDLPRRVLDVADQLPHVSLGGDERLGGEWHSTVMRFPRGHQIPDDTWTARTYGTATEGFVFEVDPNPPAGFRPHPGVERGRMRVQGCRTGRLPERRRSPSAVRA